MVAFRAEKFPAIFGPRRRNPAAAAITCSDAETRAGDAGRAGVRLRPRGPLAHAATPNSPGNTPISFERRAGLSYSHRLLSLQKHPEHPGGGLVKIEQTGETVRHDGSADPTVHPNHVRPQPMRDSLMQRKHFRDHRARRRGNGLDVRRFALRRLRSGEGDSPMHSPGAAIHPTTNRAAARAPQTSGRGFARHRRAPATRNSASPPRDVTHPR